LVASSEVRGAGADFVITTCDTARETCQVFLDKARRLYWSFIDMAKAEESENEILSAFRKVRDGIKHQIHEEFSRC
jgi:hypothetical protein